VRAFSGVVAGLSASVTCTFSMYFVSSAWCVSRSRGTRSTGYCFSFHLVRTGACAQPGEEGGRPVSHIVGQIVGGLSFAFCTWCRVFSTYSVVAEGFKKVTSDVTTKIEVPCKNATRVTSVVEFQINGGYGAVFGDGVTPQSSERYRRKRCE